MRTVVAGEWDTSWYPISTGWVTREREYDIEKPNPTNDSLIKLSLMICAKVSTMYFTKNIYSHTVVPQQMCENGDNSKLCDRRHVVISEFSRQCFSVLMKLRNFTFLLWSLALVDLSCQHHYSPAWEPLLSKTYELLTRLK